MIAGTTELIAHIGFSTHSFKAPMFFGYPTTTAEVLRSLATLRY